MANQPKISEQTAGGQQTEADKKAQEAVQEKFEKASQDAKDKISSLIGDRVSKGNLDARAIKAMEDLEKNQTDAVARIVDSKKQKFNEAAVKSAFDRERLAAELLREASAETEKYIRSLESILKKYIKDKNITNEEVLTVMKAVLGVERMNRERPELHDIVDRLGHSLELRDKDYEQIVAILNPFDFKTERANAAEGFEATAAGMIVGLMRPDQRYKLMMAFIDSPKKQQTPQLLEGWLSTGVINRFQAEQAIRESSGVNYPPEFIAKIKSGQFEIIAKKFQEKMTKESVNEVQGQFSRNIVDQFFGDGIIDSPFVYAIMTLWGAMTTGLNMWSSSTWNWDDVAGSLQKSLLGIASNPWVSVGLGATLVGGQGFTGTIQGKGFMGGAVLGALENLGSGGDEEAFIKKNAHQVLGEVYVNSPSDFASYLDNGGYETIMALKQSKVKSGQPPKVTLKELSDLEKDSARKAMLGELSKSNFFKAEDIDRKFNWVAEAAVAMEINSHSGMAAELSKIRSEQTSPILAPGTPIPAPPSGPSTGTAVAGKQAPSSTPNQTA